MRVVNLASRPFVNRRPVVRLAVILWLFGALLLGINATLYSEHWQGTAENRRRIAEVDDALESQVKTLEALDQELAQVRFRSRNRQAAFLNSIIARRTFPWSALFDHLERVMPDDVRLVAVQPDVQLAEQSTGESEESRRGEEEKPASDSVVLLLSGWAKSESALTTFLDTLYQDPAFSTPFLRGENLDRDGNTQAVRFNLSVLFYVRTPQDLEGEEAPAEEGAVVEEGAVAKEEPAVEEEPEVVARAEPTAVQPGASVPNASSLRRDAPEDEEPPAAARPTPSQRATGEPPRGQAARGAAREEAEAARARNVARQGTPPPPNRQPRSNSSDLRQRLLELQARSRARSDNREERGTPADTGRSREDNPVPGEDESPTDTKPPASSTPRIQGGGWTPSASYRPLERLEDRA
jgi:hypothetical protein